MGLVSSVHSAQRRPGPRPRRHTVTALDGSLISAPLNEGRGRDPGDTGAASSPPAPTRRALNEGRGRDPGDTPRCHVHQPFLRTRSTKAGAETPATPPRSGGVAETGPPLNEGRGRDPGDTLHPDCHRPLGAALNEGRGRDPGDTHAGTLAACGLHPRSTKAGAETPATPESARIGRGQLQRRSTKAGAETPATR